MHFNSLTLILLSASSLAVAELEKKQYGDSGYDAYYSSLEAELSSLEGTDYMNYLTDYNDYTDYPGYTDLPPDYTPYMPDVTETAGTETFAGAPVPPAPTMPSYSMDMPPASIESVLATAIPASFLSEMSNPSAVSSVVSEIQHGNFPTWYQNLPGSVKSWLMEHYATGSMPTATDGVSGSQAQGHNAAPPSGLAATGLLGAACILAAAVIL